MKLSHLTLMSIALTVATGAAHAQEGNGMTLQRTSSAGGISQYRHVEGCVETVLFYSASENSTWNWPEPAQESSRIFVNYQVRDRCSLPTIRTLVLTGEIQQPVHASKQLTSMEEEVEITLTGRSCDVINMQGPCVERSAVLVATMRWEGTGELEETKSRDTTPSPEGFSYYESIQRQRTAITTLVGTLDGEPIDITSDQGRMLYMRSTSLYVPR